MNQGKIDTILGLLRSNRGNRIVQITFRKKDGTLRNILLKKDEGLESTVKGTRPDATAKANETLRNRGMVRVEEMTPDGTFQFRTVNLNTVTQVTVNGTVYRFEEED